MKHKKIAITVASVLFAAILIISGSLLFTVRTVTVECDFATEETANEVAAEKEKLLAFVNKSVFTVNKTEVSASLSGNPYVKVLSVKVDLPSRLKVMVEERAESFCVAYGNGYYFIAEDSTVLAYRDENNSRADGEPLCVINGDTFDCEVGSVLNREDKLFNVAFTLLKGFEDSRNEIISVTVDKYNEESSSSHNEWNRIYVKTAEGAEFTIYDVLDMPEKKTELLYKVFKGLKGEERVNGKIIIFTSQNNEVDYE